MTKPTITVEQVAAWMRELPRWYVARSLTLREQQLVDAYLAIKPALTIGRLAVTQMTAEQYAGLVIKIVGGAVRARQALAAAPVDMAKTHPDLDRILCEAAPTPLA